MLGAAQDDLGASVVVLDSSLDFDLPAFELVNVSHLFEIAREHDYGEGTGFVFVFGLGLAEVEKGYTFAAVFYT